jgi:hypothetical protein
MEKERRKAMDDQMISFNVYFSDLTKEAQKRLLERFGTTERDENWDSDVFPLFIIEREEGV